VSEDNKKNSPVKLIVFLLILVALMGIAYLILTKGFPHIEKEALKDIVAEEKVLLEEFKYVENGTYMVTEKDSGNSFYGENIIPQYIAIAVKEDKVYRYVITESMYLRTATGNDITIQEGENENYGLTLDGRNVIYKLLIKDSND